MLLIRPFNLSLYSLFDDCASATKQTSRRRQSHGLKEPLRRHHFQHPDALEAYQYGDECTSTAVEYGLSGQSAHEGVCGGAHSLIAHTLGHVHCIDHANYANTLHSLICVWQCHSPCNLLSDSVASHSTPFFLCRFCLMLLCLGGVSGAPSLPGW